MALDFKPFYALIFQCLFILLDGVLLWKDLITEDNYLLAFFLYFVGANIGLAIDWTLGKRSTYLPESVQAEVAEFRESYNLTPKLGLGLPDEVVVRQSLTGMKQALSFLLIGRLFLNVKTLSDSSKVLFANEVPMDGHHIATMMEGPLAIGFAVRIICFMMLSVFGYQPRLWSVVSGIKNLAGFSSLRFLSFMSASQATKTWKQVGSMLGLDRKPEVQGCEYVGKQFFRVYMCGLTMLLYASLGLMVLLGKIEDIDLNLLKEKGFSQVWTALVDLVMTRDFAGIMSCELMQYLMFANQVVSFTDVEKVQVERLNTFLFARGSSEFDANTNQEKLSQEYMEAIALRVWHANVGIHNKVAAVLSLGPDDLQKFSVLQVKNDDGYDQIELGGR